MARKTQADKDLFGTNFTDACPKGRRRWKRDVIPELCAWLLMHHERYLTLATTLMAEPKLRNLPASKGTIDHANTACAVIRHLVDQLYDAWPTGAWDSAMALVHQIKRELESNAAQAANWPDPKPPNQKAG